MLFHAGLSADITNLSFPLIFHTILDVSLSLSPLPPSCVFWEGVHVSKGAGATTQELCLCQVKIYSHLFTWMVLDEPALMSLGSVELCDSIVYFIT